MMAQDQADKIHSAAMTPDYSAKFNLATSVHWVSLLDITVIELAFISWCFYYQLNKLLKARKKLIYVEVLEHDKKIPRIESKDNLNQVLETTQRRKNNNYLFDKYWYRKREQHYFRNEYKGFYVDSLNQVAFTVSQNFSKNQF
jgi:hypothetical protein